MMYADVLVVSCIQGHTQTYGKRPWTPAQNKRTRYAISSEGIDSGKVTAMQGLQTSLCFARMRSSNLTQHFTSAGQTTGHAHCDSVWV